MSWSDYQAEIADATERGLILNYKTRYIPKAMRIGDRLYIVNNGRVRGWMTIAHLVDMSHSWTCQTTGQGVEGGVNTSSEPESSTRWMALA